jgi:WD40 repeat protein
VVASHTLAAGLVPLGDSPSGLVFSDLARNKIELRNRRTLAVLKDLATAETNVHVDHGWLVSSADPFCNVSCRLTVQNIATAKKYQVALVDGLYVGEVAVNPNGRSVAISYWGAEAPGSVVFADLASGATEQVPGVVTESRRVADVAWTPDGRTLAISVSFTDHNLRRIALWPPNGGALKVLPGSYGSASTPWSLAAF